MRKKDVLAGKSEGSVGKVVESGVKCGEFCVNDVRLGIGCGRSDVREESVGEGDRSRERLWEMGSGGEEMVWVG